MAQLPPVTVKLNTWVDVYSATGLPIGTQVIIHNNGSNTATLSDSTSQPTGNYGFDNITPNEFLTSAATPDGVWVYSELGTTLQVEGV